MKKWILPSVVIIAVLQIIYLFYFKDGSYKLKNAEIPKQDDRFDGRLLFEFTQLDNALLAEMGEFQVSATDLESSAAMRALREKRRDILFILIYKQFVNDSKNPAKQIDFSFKKISLSEGALLNKYGLRANAQTQVRFDAFEETQGIAKVDGQIVKQKDINVNNFIWASYDSEVFRYKLAAIHKLMMDKSIRKESQKLKLPLELYREKYIYSKLPKEVNEKSLGQYMEYYNMDDTQRNRVSAKFQMLNERKRRGERYILERYVMDLPIKVNISQPAYILEEKAEWTPIIQNGTFLDMTLFSDTRTPQSKQLINDILKIVEKYKGINFKYRPLFLPSNRKQKLISKMQFCVFSKAPKMFWSFFKDSLGKFDSNVEDVLYNKASKLNIPVDGLKQCFLDKEFDQVVNYHLDYARYLGMSIGPILYVGGEVLHGNIRPKDIEAIIQRKLEVPAAGLWKKP